ncbi:MAG: methyltransferase domain-containing protein [Actinomycetota bacterium]|nr:methyltransferase domain-containing protein [Actinomycetota bacterium]
MTDVYTHGHQEPVLRAHEWRDAGNSAGYLLASLRPGMSLLDVGCGPGTITADLAGRVAPGTTVGIDAAPSVLDRARTAVGAPGAAHAAFACASVYELPLPGGTFDVVHAHQVLQHLVHPVEALSEMRRVLRPGGILAVRDADYGSFVWSPGDPMLDRWMDLYVAVTRRNGADAYAGRHLPAWVRAAGFQEATTTTSTWTFSTPEQRRWWGAVWADRTLHSSFGAQALEYGLADEDELAGIAAAWRRWSSAAEGFFAFLHVEVLATR